MWWHHKGEEREEEVGHAFRAAPSWLLLTDQSLFPLPWKTITKPHKHICHCHEKSQEDVIADEVLVKNNLVILLWKPLPSHKVFSKQAIKTEAYGFQYPSMCSLWFWLVPSNLWNLYSIWENLFVWFGLCADISLHCPGPCTNLTSLWCFWVKMLSIAHLDRLKSMWLQNSAPYGPVCSYPGT